MHYQRKLFTIPDHLVAKLSTERNQSERVTRALQAYYDSKDELGNLDQRLTGIENKLTLVRNDMNDLKQMAGLG
jgi:hypothetical protein